MPRTRSLVPITGIGDYRRALVQAAAAGLGIVIALLLSCIDYRSLVKVWPVHVALTWGLVLPTLFIRNVAIGPLTIGFTPVTPTTTPGTSWAALPSSPRSCKDQLYPYLCHAPEQVRSRINSQGAGKLLLHLAAPILIIHIQGDDAPPSSMPSSAAA